MIVGRRKLDATSQRIETKRLLSKPPMIEYQQAFTAADASRQRPPFSFVAPETQKKEGGGPLALLPYEGNRTELAQNSDPVGKKAGGKIRMRPLGLGGALWQ